jgi:hypothetical protein
MGKVFVYVPLTGENRYATTKLVNTCFEDRVFYD